ncbi:DUF2793 domain-containing protein [Metapseudomonas otitidis]|uniref:DUF2793 domain-containing protein n=1 Tax=Metapseudomonas otitidis TaxID=319939 RepID=UPI002448BCB5|nr:DUF2793 domain-containing protein [Pseudomonas otitidis]MDH0335205.1 DUF2793 domain-containing protein [Pseudomonas otitidis]
MTQSAKLELEYLQNSAANQILANTTFALLDQLVQAGAVDKDLSAPPGSPANGSLYIVAASATGAWVGKSGQLAFWLTSVNAWSFITPKEGFLVHVNDEDQFYKFNGSSWVVFSGGGSGSGIVSIVAGTGIAVDATDPENPIISATGSGGMTNPMTTRGDIITGGTSGSPQRLAKGTSGQMLVAGATDPGYSNSPILGGYAEILETMSGTSIDVSTSNVKKKVLSANTTFSLTGATSGQCHSFTLMLEGGSSYTVTWPGSVKWLGSSPAYTAKDVITGFTIDGGTTWLLTYAGSYV